MIIWRIFLFNFTDATLGDGLVPSLKYFYFALFRKLKKRLKTFIGFNHGQTELD